MANERFALASITVAALLVGAERGLAGATPSATGRRPTEVSGGAAGVHPGGRPARPHVTV